MIDEILTLISDLPSPALHLFFFMAALIENIFPPWPGDTFIVFAGFLSAHGVVTLPMALLSTGFGSLTGALIMFLAGDRFLFLARKVHEGLRPGFVKRLLSSLIAAEQMERTRIWFQRWGAWFVLVSRFSAGIRFFVSIVAGLSKMNLLLFVFCFSLGVLVWNMLLLGGGRLLAENWRKMLDWLQYYNVVIGLLIVVAVAVLIIRRMRSASGT